MAVLVAMSHGSTGASPAVTGWQNSRTENDDRALISSQPLRARDGTRSVSTTKNGEMQGTIARRVEYNSASTGALLCLRGCIVERRYGLWRL